MNAPQTAKTDQHDQSGDAVTFDSVSKIFGSARALEQLSFSVKHGTIHGIIGENGAGKSTAMKILYGLHRPSSGKFFVDGIARDFRSPFDAMSLGIGMIHQHFMLAEPLSVHSNITLGSVRQIRWSGKQQEQSERERIQAIADQYGLAIDPNKTVAQLSVGEKQRVEIVKLLYRNARILIMDEPTAVLSPQEVDTLFTQLIRLKSEGKTIIVITHKLSEMCRYADRVTVMRRGRDVASLPKQDLSTDRLGALMLGHSQSHDVVQSDRSAARKTDKARPTALSLENAGADRLSFSVAKGEILGIAGVQGNGQNELLEFLLSPGTFRKTGCRARLLGQDVSAEETAGMRARGVRFIPPDRHLQAVVLSLSARDNFMLGKQRNPALARWGFFTKTGIKRIEDAARSTFLAFAVQPDTSGSRDLTMGEFSGGNQQKQVVGRELQRFVDDPEIALVVAAEPCRGVDIGAAATIHGQLRAIAAQGAALLVVSSELEELYALSDRILVLSGHAITGEFSRSPATGSFNHEAIGLAMGGVSQS
jgi:simple sugar transport system ATP-binding protein